MKVVKADDTRLSSASVPAPREVGATAGAPASVPLPLSRCGRTWQEEDARRIQYKLKVS